MNNLIAKESMIYIDRYRTNLVDSQPKIYIYIYIYIYIHTHCSSTYLVPTPLQHCTSVYPKESSMTCSRCDVT